MSNVSPLEKAIVTYSVREIIVLCHFHKNNIMPVIICKHDKHLVILHNAIFSNMTGILSYLNYIFY